MLSQQVLFQHHSETGRTFTITRFRTDTALTSKSVPDDYVLKCDSGAERAVSVTMDSPTLYGLMMAIQAEVNVPDVPEDDD